MARVLAVRLASTTQGGQQRYEESLLRALNDTSMPQLSVEEVRVTSWRGHEAGAVRLPLAAVGALPRVVARQVSALVLPRHDLVHRLDLRLPPARCEVVTVHDTAWLHFQDEASPGRGWRRDLARAKLVLTPSEFAASEVRRGVGDIPIRVVPNGTDPAVALASVATSEDLCELGITGPFALCSGGRTQRKNIASLVRAWARVDPRVQLVITGGAPGRVDRILQVGHLSRHQQLRVLRAASVVVVPSTYEGFGLPVIEGFAAGVPVVAAARASLPEVAAGAALLCEPDELSLAEAINTIFGEQVERRQERIQRGRERAAELTWSGAAAATMAAYRSALNS